MFPTYFQLVLRFSLTISRDLSLKKKSDMRTWDKGTWRSWQQFSGRCLSSPPQMGVPMKQIQREKSQEVMSKRWRLWPLNLCFRRETIKYVVFHMAWRGNKRKMAQGRSAWAFAMGTIRFLSSSRCPSPSPHVPFCILKNTDLLIRMELGTEKSRGAISKNRRPTRLCGDFCTTIYSTQLCSHPYCQGCCWIKTPKWNAPPHQRNEAVKPNDPLEFNSGNWAEVTF